MPATITTINHTMVVIAIMVTSETLEITKHKVVSKVAHSHITQTRLMEQTAAVVSISMLQNSKNLHFWTKANNE